MSITQGGQYNSGKIGIIEQGFKSANSEGFVGILGSNYDMDQVINSDTATTIAGTTRLNDNDRQYGQSYKTLRVKTNQYVDALPANRLKQNYNVFVNKSVSPYQIPEQNQKKCVTASSISNLTLADGFATSYPDSLTNYNDAKIACKFWAANAGKTTFAVNKNLNGKYQCYIGNGLNSTITEKFKPGKIYTVLEGDNTSTKGGLFFNGQIGLWSGNISSVETTYKKPMMIKKYNSNSYSSTDKPLPAALGGWWGNSNPGARDDWGVNKFPNSIAWWIGNLPVENNPNATFAYFQTNGTSYFYYNFENSTARNIYIYYVCENRRGDGIKINGTTLATTELPRTANTYNAVGGNGWEATTYLGGGKNVFEISLPTGLPNSGFVFYAATQDKNTVLFKSGDEGWFVSPTPISDSSFLFNPMNMKALNQAPAGFNKCDPIIGGGLIKQSIKATYGKNCSDITIRPTNIRYIKITPNSKNDVIQIGQIVVNALLPDGRIMNVANKGTVTVPPDDYTHPLNAIDGNLTPKGSYNMGFQSGYYVQGKQTRFWQLDLGKDYLATEVVYYNRYDCCRERAIGMILQLTASDGTAQKPITLNDSYIQSFKFPIT